MAMKLSEVKEWLDYFDDEEMVAIDDGGLSIVIVGKKGAYCEIGGIPEDED